MTPRQLTIAYKAYTEKKKAEAEEYQIKLKNEQRLLTVQAYQISRWVWAKKLDINKILEEKKQSKIMTNEEMFQQVKMLNSIFGGEVK